MRTLYGVNPVREFLRAGGEGLSELWVAEGAKGSVQEILRLAKGHNAKVRTAPKPKLDQLAGDSHHQGVVAVVSDFRYTDVDALVAAASRKGPALLVLLDGIEDPHNLGAIIRSAQALGAAGVIIAKDRAAGVTPTVAKVSAGAIERCPVARVTNIARTLEELKEKGIWSVGLDASGTTDLTQVDLTGPTVLVVGAEGAGIRPLVKRGCDHLARIPMQGDIGSLNASASAAVALYEVGRQRRAKSR